MDNALFNEITINRLVSDIKPTAKQKKASERWLDLIEKGELIREKQGYLNFYDVILKDLLGYENIKHEKEGIEFSYEKDGRPIVRIEAKGMDTKDLFLLQKRAKEESPVQQLWRYMQLHASPYGIVTNYKTFILFKYDVGSTKYHEFDFEDIKNNKEKLKEFIAIFSRGSIDNNFVENLYEKSIVEEREFTKEFYKLYHETRLMLIKEFEENSDIGREASVHFAQLFLNRLMFVFFAEDTGKLDKRIIEKRILETLGNQSLFSSNSSNISNVIVNLFNDLDKGSDFPVKVFGFNGGLFKNPVPPRIHFKDLRDNKFFKDVKQYSKLRDKNLELNEKEREIFDKYKNKLNLVIENILIMGSFDFNTEVSVNILGHIFEQSISDIEDLKADNNARRKKEGVYYTPEYITDYICRNTIIPYLSEKGAMSVPDLIKEYSEDIDELENKFKKMKILDPACGSGAFLIKATDVMLEIFKAIQEFKQQEGVYEAKRGLKKKGNKKGQLVLEKWDEEGEAKEIIENNICGVDINEESVEITKLSLFLKMARKNRKLTDLSKNIKQGNSLIDDEEVAGKLAFNWNEEFKEVLDNGGFDVVIGNPPYGAKLPEEEVKFVKKNYSVGNSETAQLMMEKSYLMLKDSGYHGFIIPKAFTFVSTWDKIRAKFLDELKILVDCGKVWKEVKLEQSIYTIQKGNKVKKYKTCKREENNIKELSLIDKGIYENFGFLFNGITDEELKIGIRINKIHDKLGNFCDNKRGMIISDYSKIENSKKPENKKLLCGANIGRYLLSGVKGYFPDKSKIPDNAKIKNNSVFVQGIVAHIQNPNDHIKIIATIPDNSEDLIMDNINQIILEKGISNYYVLLILNSKLMGWYCYRFIYAKAIRTMRFDNPVTSRIPIPKISIEEQKPFIEKAYLMLKLNKDFYYKKDKVMNRIKGSFEIEKLSRKIENFYEYDFNSFIKEIEKLSNKTISLKEKDEWEDYFNNYKKELSELKEEIDRTDREIDEMVYKLYGLTDEEIKVVEGEIA